MAIAAGFYRLTAYRNPVSAARPPALTAVEEALLQDGDYLKLREVSVRYLVPTGVDEAVVRCVNHRGDADSTGAVAGQLAGAIYGSVYGFGRIPDRKFDLEGHAAHQALATHLTNRATVLREVR